MVCGELVLLLTILTLIGPKGVPGDTGKVRTSCVIEAIPLTTWGTIHKVGSRMSTGRITDLAVLQHSKFKTEKAFLIVHILYLSL